ncbi:hypothetical protein Q4489_12545 [Thalassotalea sp. 1_MG-2023]|uniref:hypothetical protein n=1 Tax=Thalassotalea sp. 1_MG-2023 TaxID=3062680 RepID=UPI0026E40325|nr:hypothetical protein [Thalassotalea sp. 1_MG-2023]MDO6427849.1 hypothetical protein [Thalassotalea sp. 1_MG-2023]
MEANFWHKCWERNTLGFHQLDYHPLLERVILPELLKDECSTKQPASFVPIKRVLVPLSGKSDDMIWFAEYANVVGSELSKIACQDFFKEKEINVNSQRVGDFYVYQHENITLWQGDFFSLTTELVGEFDWIYDRAALIALPESMQQAYIHQLQRFIKPQTKLFLLTLEFPANEMSGPPFPVDELTISEFFSGYNVTCLHAESLPDKRFAQRMFNVSHLVEKLYLITQN